MPISLAKLTITNLKKKLRNSRESKFKTNYKNNFYFFYFSLNSCVYIYYYNFVSIKEEITNNNANDKIIIPSFTWSEIIFVSKGEKYFKQLKSYFA